ncbi:transcription elongation factor GreA [Candidatus Giovannonibacteria bacterium]|nr:transcription elongation factor GreA [Candidatus Giovannonibacteria bacterium]
MPNNVENSEYLSESGFQRLKEELQQLKEVRRKEIASRLEYALSLGDISENAEYSEAKEEQLTCEARILGLEDILNRAVLISHKNDGFINLGATVHAKKEGSEQIESYFIVGSEEANPAEKKISNESPLGKSFLGKKKGDIVSVYTPKGEMRYHIIDIA